MATIDLGTNTGKVRLNIGDTSDIPFLSDDEIDYSLSYNSDNVNAATKQCAGFILAKMAFQGHERLDKLEFWGDSFERYMRFLKEIINSAVYSGTAGIYVAGMLKDDVAANNTDTTIVQHKLPVYPYEDYNNEDERTTSSNLF